MKVISTCGSMVNVRAFLTMNFKKQSAAVSTLWQIRRVTWWKTPHYTCITINWWYFSCLL